MTPKRATAKPKPAKSLEQTLWDAADKMRGNPEATEYKHVALGLVFLKYVSDAFEQLSPIGGAPPQVTFSAGGHRREQPGGQ